MTAGPKNPGRSVIDDEPNCCAPGAHGQVLQRFDTLRQDRDHVEERAYGPHVFMCTDAGNRPISLDEIRSLHIRADNAPLPIPAHIPA